MKAAIKAHLDGLCEEISSLIENSKPGGKSAIASWTKNSDEIDVALKVIGAVSGYIINASHANSGVLRTPEYC